MTDHSRALTRQVYDSISQSSEAHSVSPGDVQGDCTGGDAFVCVTPRSSQSAGTQLALLAEAAKGAVDHAEGSQAMDENGKFTAAPEGDSITAVVAGESFLRLDIDNPDEWHDISQSRLMTRAAMSMERI